MTAADTTPMTADEAGQGNRRRAALQRAELDRMTMASSEPQHDLFVGRLKCLPIRSTLETAS